MKVYIDPIPKEILPKANYLNCGAYRALKHEFSSLDDFIPSFVGKRNDYFNSREQIKAPSMFSLSLYNTQESLERALLCAQGLSKHIIAYGIGDTSDEFGLATEPDKHKGHIDYFLYDYRHNNPYKTFRVELRKKVK